jgi:hypothetical protein
VPLARPSHYLTLTVTSDPATTSAVLVRSHSSSHRGARTPFISASPAERYSAVPLHFHSKAVGVRIARRPVPSVLQRRPVKSIPAFGISSRAYRNYCARTNPSPRRRLPGSRADGQLRLQEVKITSQLPGGRPQVWHPPICPATIPKRQRLTVNGSARLPSRAGRAPHLLKARSQVRRLASEQNTLGPRGRAGRPRSPRRGTPTTAAQPRGHCGRRRASVRVRTKLSNLFYRTVGGGARYHASCLSLRLVGPSCDGPGAALAWWARRVAAGLDGPRTPREL